MGIKYKALHFISLLLLLAGSWSLQLFLRPFIKMDFVNLRNAGPLRFLREERASGELHLGRN